ncbi:MAG: small ribosomal subunit Rsm22 family protein [Hyphomonadaceae bacterium]
MELPLRLRQAIEAALHAAPLSEIAADARALSDRYRGEVRDGRLHVSSERMARAYVAARMPATYAAIHASLSALADRLPGFAPASLLDVGAGPGTTLWAAADIWPDLKSATLLEASADMRAMGHRLAADVFPDADWKAADALRDNAGGDADLVTLAYVLDELAPHDRKPLLDRLWRQARTALVIVEPGTPAGWQRILDARDQLIAAGAHILAPCPHAHACPILAPDWCHFSARVARSRIHRLAKGADVPWEDEKFACLVASRAPAAPSPARVLAPPEPASGRVRLKLCQPDGTALHRLVTRREGDAFRSARRVDWGDLFDG